MRLRVSSESRPRRNSLPTSGRDTHPREGWLCPPRIQMECSRPWHLAPALAGAPPSGREAKDSLSQMIAFSWGSPLFILVIIFEADLFFLLLAPLKRHEMPHFRVLFMEAQCTGD